MIGSILSAVSQRDFFQRDQIIELARRVAERPTTAREAGFSDGGYQVDTTRLRALLIFATPRQQVWLVADQLRVYVVLDDRQWEEPQITASVALNLAVPVTVATGGRGTSGRLRLGALGGELQISMLLFQRVEAREIIEEFLQETDA